jgi:flagellar biosynthetic protein FlhB
VAESAQDRTLPATPRKIDKARAEGQVARSRDLGHFAAFLAAGLLLAGLAPWIVETMAAAVARGLRFDVTQLGGTRPMVERLGDSGWHFVFAAVPLGLVMVLVALGVSVIGGGWNFSWKAIQPRWEKLDPVSGLGRVFSMQQFGMALKACLLAVVLGAIGAVFLWTGTPRFIHALGLSLPAALSHTGSAVGAGVLLLVLGLGVFALVDVPLQRWVWKRQLRMSHEELKKEMKESEGNPEVKSRIRSRMREMANKRTLAAVPGADLVVMNPSHFAVALKYDEKTMAAPRVVAKGADLMAFRIRDAAKASKVPVLQAPPLARALYAHAEVDREIPAALFGAVAQVLAWVYQLRASMSGRGLPPADLPPLAVPPELDPMHASSAAGAPPDQRGAAPEVDG